MNSPIHVTLMMEAIRSSESSVLTKAARRNIPEDGIPKMISLVTLYFYHKGKLVMNRQALYEDVNWFQIGTSDVLQWTC
jgi:hypothetical protein